MVVNKNSLYHKFFSFASILLLLFPAAQVSGPLLTDFFLILISIIFLFIHSQYSKIFLSKNKIIKLFIKLFIIFYIYLVLGSIFSDNLTLSLKPSLTYFRFGIFSLAIFFILKNNKNFFKYFYIILSITLVIILFDGYFQYFTGKNIFGYKTIRPERLSGLFFNELVLGGYLSKLLPIFCTLVFLNKEILRKKYIFTFILLIYILIFLSGERAAFLLSSLYLVMILPFILDLKKMIILLLLITTIFGSLLSFNKVLKDRMINQFLTHIVYKCTDNDTYTCDDKVYIMPDHYGIFVAAIDIFKKNMLFGSGVKTFRVLCKDSDQLKMNRLNNTIHNFKYCSTHPHNYYLQLLSETGIIGFLFVALIFFKLLLNYFKEIYYVLIKKKKANKAYICILSGLINAIWPLTTTGSFFNNWVCSFIFITVGIYLFLSNELKN